MKLVTTEEMREIERAANEGGLGYATMMERAGQAVALAIKERVDPPSARILILVGPGNNGGDGLVAGRYLHEWQCEVTIYIWKRDKDDDPNLARAQELQIPIIWATEDGAFQQLDALVRECNVLIDALLGTGVTGPLRGGLRDLLGAVHRSLAARATQPAADGVSLRNILSPPDKGQRSGRPLLVAVDVPTGLHCDTGEIDELALDFDVTVTFAYPKRGHFLFPGASHVGELLVADIGIDPKLAEGVAVEVAAPEQIASMLPARPLDAHKGTFGKALIVGGSANYVGAPCLAAEAAYRVGAGLVTLAVPQRIHPIVAAKVTEPTFLVLPDDMGVLVPTALRVLAERIDDYDVLLVGPGLGTEPSTRDFCSGFISGQWQAGPKPIGFGVSRRSSQEPLRLPPLVLDADALNLLSGLDRWWERLPTESVLTPHPGEMARLVGCDVPTVQRDRIGTARRAACRWKCSVVLKGAYSVVASPEGTVTIIPFANPALATAGSGDVLAGAIVGLMAQGVPSFHAAICGAYLHGLAAEIRCEEYGQMGMLASDLLPLLPLAVKRASTPS